ncbi:MAG: ATP-binding cassette domain-containing protein [Coxiellaceae bacterium]|jgi:phospholipid/cholesterol/gamma-HCH transport system ATP-binding protein|nr:ATP-binding cassette domain-containing protein [Coxiellaceae bacterium]
MADNFIKIQTLSFARNDRWIFRDIDLCVPRGKITAIMGPSGSGKTTLLRLISAQLYPAQGQVLVNGVNIHSLNRPDLYKIRTLMGMLFQSGALFTNLNVFENVAFPLREHTRLPEDIIRSVVLMQLEAVGLRGARDLMPAELSGGMARRVALARALVLNPQLMMYDEPFTGQDPITMGVLVKLIKHLNDILGLTSIIISHDVQETMGIADYIYVIADSRVVGQGTREQITHDRSLFIDQFIHGLADGPVPFHYPAKLYMEDLKL